MKRMEMKRSLSVTQFTPPHFHLLVHSDVTKNSGQQES